MQNDSLLSVLFNHHLNKDKDLDFRWKPAQETVPREQRRAACRTAERHINTVRH